jgi:hypothetical protein
VDDQETAGLLRLPREGITMKKAISIATTMLAIALSAVIAQAEPRKFVKHMACHANEYQEPDQTIRWRVQTKLTYTDETFQEKLYAVTDSRKKAIGFCEKWFDDETKAEQARRKAALKLQAEAKAN